MNTGRTLKAFRTNYSIQGYLPEGQLGLTLRREMIPTPTKYKEMTICLRIKMDYFTVTSNYIPILELLDGGGLKNGVEVEPFKARTIDFRIRFNTYCLTF